MAEMSVDEVMIYAQKLQSLLQIVDHATRQVHILDVQLLRLDRQLFHSTLDDNQALVLHLLTRKSVVQGVRRMFDQYRSTKHRQVQELSALIINHIQDDREESSLEAAFNMRTTTETDELARLSTTNYSILWRGV